VASSGHVILSLSASVPFFADWAIMTITSIGYGDIAAATGNTAEQVVCTILMISGSMMWGMVLGTFCGVVASINPNGRDFRQRMDALNAFMGYQVQRPTMSEKESS
jgi:hypothetical protein